MISDDTICAVSTAPGVGGIAVARISGPDAIAVADKVWCGKRLADKPSHTATFGRIVDKTTNEILDEGVATVFRGPHSFTGEDVVEFSVHGSLWVQGELINLLIRNGCRMAGPGEFTRRAFAAGKMDLAEAEAVADVIASTSRAAHRVAMSQMRGHFSDRLAALRDQLLELASLLELELDFSEEDVEFAERSRLLDLSEQTLAEVNRLAASFATGDVIRRGVPVAIIGEPNVGKSSLLNRLLGDDRAIVSDVPGTTRDTVEDTADIKGVTFRFVDTAGLRETDDTVEALGIGRAWDKIAAARIILWVITPTASDPELAEFGHELASRKNVDAKIVLVVNKADLVNHVDLTDLHSRIDSVCDSIVAVSAKNGQGIDQLTAVLHEVAMSDIYTGQNASDDVIVTNARHYEALLLASASLERAIEGLSASLSGDFVAQDIRETIHHLSAITGTITTPDILSSIFSRFCIGK